VARETIPPSETDDGNFWECRANGLSAKANVIGEGTVQVATDELPAGMTKEVTFEPVGGQINNSIDGAYRTKYASSPYLKPMIGERARDATVRVVQHETTK
jgi:hypothetical protein